MPVNKTGEEGGAGQSGLWNNGRKE